EPAHDLAAIVLAGARSNERNRHICRVYQPPRVEWLAAKERLDIVEGKPLRSNTRNPQPHLVDLASMIVEPDQGRQTHQRDDKRTAMANFLEAAAKSWQGVAFDGDQQFAL